MFVKSGTSVDFQFSLCLNVVTADTVSEQLLNCPYNNLSSVRSE